MTPLMLGRSCNPQLTVQAWGLWIVIEEVLKVLEKCASLTCSAVFRHQGDGMLLRVPRVGTKSSLSGAAKKKVSIERFWLCSECAETMTLKFDRCCYRKVRVNVIPLSPVSDAAA
jgi:hypothetical protein